MIITEIDIEQEGDFLIIPEFNNKIQVCLVQLNKVYLDNNKIKFNLDKLKELYIIIKIKDYLDKQNKVKDCLEKIVKIGMKKLKLKKRKKKNLMFIERI